MKLQLDISSYYILHVNSCIWYSCIERYTERNRVHPKNFLPEKNLSCIIYVTQKNLPEKTVIPEDVYVGMYILPGVENFRYKAIFTMTIIVIVYLYFGRKSFKLAGNASQMIQITWMVTQH